MALPKSLPRVRTKAPPPDPARQTVQRWLPVADVRQEGGVGIMVRRDGSVVAAVRIQPVPIGLMSIRERARRIEALLEVIQGLVGHAGFPVIPRPLDLDAYIQSLDAAADEAQGIRRKLLTNYTRHVRGLAQGGDALEHRFYVVLAQKGPTASADVSQRATELVAALGRADTHAHVADEQELRDVLFTFLNPAVAAFERAEPTTAATIYQPEVPEGESTWHSST